MPRRYYGGGGYSRSYYGGGEQPTDPLAAAKPQFQKICAQLDAIAGEPHTLARLFAPSPQPTRARWGRHVA